MNKPLVEIKVLNIDHLGIVAGIIDEMELVEIVNQQVGIKEKEMLTPGQIMKAMILNGLGFLSAPLYLFEQFFIGKATEHLIGEGVLPSHLNDDRLARALDKYYAVGTTQLFTAIAIKAAEKFQVKMNSIHWDGTSMYVHGEYAKAEEKGVNSVKIEGEVKIQESEPESEMTAIDIKHGYSRDHRPDLKQFIVDMICTGDGDIPLYLKIDSGNIDDKSVFVERLKEFKKSWTFEGVNVADSALYTKDNIIAMREMKWITRVPLSIKLAQDKILNIEDDQWTDSEISGYKMVEKESDYGEIKQRWLIVESEARKKSSIEQVNKQVEKQKAKASTAIRKLSKQNFACEPDAKMAIEKLSNSFKYHKINNIQYQKKAEYEQSGRPSKLAMPTQINYRVTGELETKLEVIEAEKTQAGRFILATNIIDKNELSNESVLKEYKAQQSTERGFRFLKDPLFFTSSVFVKNPQRVEAIAMIMGLCLLVYTLAQRKLRQELESSGISVKNQVKKLTNKPTMRWIFQVFQAVHLITVNGHKQVSNLTVEHRKILSCLGTVCRQYYLII
jgi:transposase